MGSLKLLFFTLFLLLFGLIHLLAHRRIVRKLHLGHRAKRGIDLFLLANFLGNCGYVAARYMTDLPKPLYALFSISIGVSFILLLSILLYELLHLLQRHLPFQKERRRLFKRSGDLAFLAAGAGVTSYSIAEGVKRPVVKRVEVRQERFGGERYRIVQISDMHIGGLIDRRFVEESVERTNALNPDLVAITGDLTDLPVRRLAGALEPLRDLKSRFGTFYVPGNHEYFHGIEATLAHLEGLGIRVLGNRSVDLGSFHVVGVYDLFGFRYKRFVPDIAAATRGIPDGAPTLLLAHQPRFVRHLGAFRPSLMLCGHTHGGQIWPFGYLVRLQQPYLAGLFPLAPRRHIYVNSGIGFWGPPMRLGTEAEITCIEWS
ncbi:metallophosphoesterase [Hydrogenimonas sp.]